ncbi:MarR family transcriptional regulator [bacterium]|nr:MarR family transcriptional regulator [bacterium]
MPTNSQALAIWQGALASLVRDEVHDLTVRQLAILSTVYTANTPPTIRGLSAELSLAKPVVTRAIDTLEKHDLCRRHPDGSDGRSVIIQRTVRGSVYTAALGDEIKKSLLT